MMSERPAQNPCEIRHRTRRSSSARNREMIFHSSGAPLKGVAIIFIHAGLAKLRLF